MPPAVTRQAALRALAALEKQDHEERVALAEIQDALAILSKTVDEMVRSKVRTSDKQQAAVLAFVKG
jgi:hypothetical protein